MSHCPQPHVMQGKAFFFFWVKPTSRVSSRLSSSSLEPCFHCSFSQNKQSIITIFTMPYIPLNFVLQNKTIVKSCPTIFTRICWWSFVYVCLLSKPTYRPNITYSFYLNSHIRHQSTSWKQKNLEVKFKRLLKIHAFPLQLFLAIFKFPTIWGVKTHLKTGSYWVYIELDQEKQRPWWNKHFSFSLEVSLRTKFNIIIMYTFLKRKKRTK